MICEALRSLLPIITSDLIPSHRYVHFSRTMEAVTLRFLLSPLLTHYRYPLDRVVVDLLPLCRSLR